jgi:asparagine synthetase B (glutamine-hydrolysing)
MAKKFPAKEEYRVHNKRSEAIAAFMTAHLKAVRSKRVGVFLSAGVDSHAVLFAALRAGKQVTCYSFTLADRKSTDFRLAEQTAAVFGLPFVPVVLPTDTAQLQRYVWSVFHTYNTNKIHINKSSVECLWPLYSGLAKSVETNGVTALGLGGDTFFCMLRSQKKRLHEYEKVKAEYMTNVVVNGNDVQTLMLNNWLAKHSPKHQIVCPFHTTEMFALFKGMHPFDPGCKPIQKAPLRLAFWEEFSQVDVRVHQSFQKGDSGISDHFESALITSSWNTRNLKSVKGVYNDVELKRVPKPQGPVW